MEPHIIIHPRNPCVAFSTFVKLNHVNRFSQQHPIQRPLQNASRCGGSSFAVLRAMAQGKDEQNGVMKEVTVDTLCQVTDASLLGGGNSNIFFIFIPT